MKKNVGTKILEIIELSRGQDCISMFRQELQTGLGTKLDFDMVFHLPTDVKFGGTIQALEVALRT